jgi:hypothetical protein
MLTIQVSRRLVPWYDARFRGYGRNKVVHIRHMAVLGFVFRVHPLLFVVHAPHPPSAAFNVTLGPARTPGRFNQVSTQSTFSEHSVNIQGTFREHSGNIQSTFSQHSVNIQGTFSQHSVNIQ